MPHWTNKPKKFVIIKIISQILQKVYCKKPLLKLEEDAFAPALKTHKLSGDLYGYLACSCGYGCRIIPQLKKLIKGEFILLIDIGTHEEVY